MVFSFPPSQKKKLSKCWENLFKWNTTEILKEGRPRVCPTFLNSTTVYVVLQFSKIMEKGIIFQLICLRWWYNFTEWFELGIQHIDHNWIFEVDINIRKHVYGEKKIDPMTWKIPTFMKKFEHFQLYSKSKIWAHTCLTLWSSYFYW